MRAIQVFLQGGRHKATQRPCEDRTYSMSLNGVNVIALSDGAGSQKYTHSAQGAECVCKTVCKFFCNNFDKFYSNNDEEELKTVIASVCQNQLLKLTEELELDGIFRLSSTLLCVAVKDERMIACHIGDGVIGKLTTDGTEVISAPDNGEFAGTTYFITGNYAAQKICIFKQDVKDVLAYFLMSDGTADYVYDDLNKSFHDAARKMALLSFKRDGQEQLQKTVQKFMIDLDPKSDDCSFICLSLMEENEAVETAPTVSMGLEISEAVKTSKSESKSASYSSIEESEEIEDLMSAYAEHKSKSDNRSIKPSKKKKRVLVAALIAVVLGGCVSAWGIIHVKNVKSQTEATEETVIKVDDIDEKGINNKYTTTKTQESTLESTDNSKVTSKTSSVKEKQTKKSEITKQSSTKKDNSREKIKSSKTNDNSVKTTPKKRENTTTPSGKIEQTEKSAENKPGS